MNIPADVKTGLYAFFVFVVGCIVAFLLWIAFGTETHKTVLLVGTGIHGFAPHGRSTDHWVPHKGTTAVRGPQLTLRTNPVIGEMYNVAQPNGKQPVEVVLVEANPLLGGGAASELRLSPLAGNPGMYEGSNGGTYAVFPGSNSRSSSRSSSRRSKGNPRNRSNKRDTRT
jgi:hypothetical protein